MKFTSSDIKSFQKLYSEHFYVDISEDVARLKLMLLVRQLEIAYQPAPYELLDDLQNEYEDDNHEYSKKEL